MNKKKLYVLIAAGAALLVAASVLVAVAAVNANTIKVAFYDVDERVQGAVKDQVGRMNLRRVKFFVLDGAAELPKKVEKKYSLLIAKNSLAVKSRAQKFVPVDEGLFEALPTSIRKATLDESGERHYAIPILLDHFEIGFYDVFQKALDLKIPQSYGGLLRYLSAVKERAEFPLACAGAEDSELLAFVSAMAQSLYGAQEYKKALDVLRESAALNKNNLPEAITRVLDEIKAMQERGLIHQQWTKATFRDLRYFMQERKVGAAAMHLSARRNVEYNLIKYYSSSLFPQYNGSVDRGVIAPQIVAALLSPKKEAALILGQLVSADIQSELSNISLLAPVALRAESVDRQADDVRFWAASSAAGALGGVEEECEILSDRRRLLAKKIRAYLEN